MNVYFLAVRPREELKCLVSETAPSTHAARLRRPTKEKEEIEIM